MTFHTIPLPSANLPVWLPQAARHYLEHTEFGVPIRELARQADLHASTVLRQIRRFETRRDDMLVDEALRTYSHALSATITTPESAHMPPSAPMLITSDEQAEAEKLNLDCLRVLRRMAEPGAVMAVARDMEKGVVVREGADGATQRLAVVDRDIAQAMAMREWIRCDDPEARISRYRISGPGRSALKEMIAAQENIAQGFAEAQSSFRHDAPISSRVRPSLMDSPLSSLARRRGRDGQPFLGRTLVAAGERLREDYELSSLSEDSPSDWHAYLAQDGADQPLAKDATEPAAAQHRVTEALRELGPGLGDVALRACCLLEGMESLEKRMGWSARSGKIVLRIALQRLSMYYAAQNGGLGPKIG